MSALIARLRHVRLAVAAALVAIGALTSLSVATLPAHADTQICEQYGSTTIQGKYVVMNNRWGTSEQQCINVTDNGFQVTTANGSVPTNGAPKSYPAIYNGCHYANCSPGTNLPKQLSTIGSAPTSISYTYTGNAVFDAAYDIWLDPTAKKDGVNRTEIMVWFNHVGPVQPVGSKTGTANVGGRSWDVWTGNNGGNDVISFVAPSAISSWTFDVMDFANSAIQHGLAQNSWYLTSVQAGFEPWQNGAGLAVTSFSSAVNSGSNDPGNPGDGDPGNPGGPLACKVTNTPNSWPGGFTSNITITNTGSSAVNGWKLNFNLPAGQTITSSWNAGISPNSGSVTATNVAHNGQIAPGGSQSFGFQGTWSGGTYAQPAAYSLNGTNCTVG